jgi:hypothetical protein
MSRGKLSAAGNQDPVPERQNAPRPHDVEGSAVIDSGLGIGRGGTVCDIFAKRTDQGVARILTSMKLLSINVSMPRRIPVNGGEIETGIFKVPVAGPIRVKELDLEGDSQADLTVL